jgi:YhcH/YjgK/YiaL family protein
MILDKLENKNLYKNLSLRIARGLQYLAETDFSKVTAGKHLIEGENIYAILSTYPSKEQDDCKLEAHRKYIDIQYIVSGCERIGVTVFNGQAPIIPYNEEKDVTFFKEKVSFLRIETGMFAIFFPGDLHMPCVKCNEPVNVTKVVVKVRV